MKTIASILGSIALTICFTLPILAADGETPGNEIKTEVAQPSGDDSSVATSEPSEDTPSKESEATPSQGWITGLTQKASSLASYYLGGSQAAQTTTPPANETKKGSQEAEVKHETSKPVQSAFDRVARRQYLITAGLAACATGLNYYCANGGCYGSQLAQGIAGAAPALVGYLTLSTGIAYFTI